MRIVGGTFRGRALAAPKSNDIRPTTDRTREALFNILAHAHGDVLDGARVLDLFSGTGALGLEALSRGASSALFVEPSAEGRGLLRTNIEALGVQGRARIFRRDATDIGPVGTMEPFTLLFADPPYGKGPRDDRGDRKPGNRPGGKPYGKGPRDGTRSGPRDGNRPGPRGAGPKGPRGPKRGDR